LVLKNPLMPIFIGKELKQKLGVFLKLQAISGSMV
jgi:hypothetical protein